MPTLVCRKVWFYSQTDETAFFEWLGRIKCISKVKGVADEIHLHVPRRRISDLSLRELIAIFERYDINVKQLAQFVNPENQVWFKENRKAYWHKKAFE